MFESFRGGQFFSAEGANRDEGMLQLEPGMRISKLLSELVPSNAGQVRGFIIIRSTIGLAAQELFGDTGLNLLSAVPPTVVQ